MTITDRYPVRAMKILKGAVTVDPFEHLLHARDTDPFRTDSNGGSWIVTKYEQCREVQQDYRRFTHASPSIDLHQPLMPSFFDPPYQTKLRSVVLPLMTAAAIDPLEPRMHQATRGLCACGA